MPSNMKLNDADIAALVADIQSGKARRVSATAETPQPTPPATPYNIEFGGPDTARMGAGISEAAGNIIPSAFNYGSNLVEGVQQIVRHPIDSAKALYGTAVGLGEKALGAEIDTDEERGRQAQANAVVDYVKSRYGTMEQAQNTFVKDPVGFLADVATVTLPVGGAMKAVGKVPGLAKVGAAGQAVTKAGAAMEPINLGVKGIGKAGQMLIPETGKLSPSGLYQSAAKFSTSLPVEQRAKMVSTALENEIMPNITGINNLRDKITELNTKIAAKIDDAAKTGAKVNPEELTADFRDLYVKARESGAPLDAKAAIDNIKEQFLTVNTEPLTPDAVQRIKQNIYKQLESSYSQVSEAPFKVKAQKAIARSAKLALEKVLPEIKELNRTEGTYIELLDEIEKAASRISNRDVVGLGMTTKSIAGGAVAGAPGSAAGIALGILDIPLVKAKLAILLDKMRRQGIQVSPTSAIFKLGLAEPQQIEEQR